MDQTKFPLRAVPAEELTVSGMLLVEDAQGGLVAHVVSEEGAELIAKACNSHADLVQVLTDIMLTAVRRQASGGDIYDFQDSLRVCADKARAALSRVKAGQ